MVITTTLSGSEGIVSDVTCGVRDVFSVEAFYGAHGPVATSVKFFFN